MDPPPATDSGTPGTSLRLMVWNVRCLETRRQKKLKDWTVRRYISEHEIVGLVETHTHPLSDIVVEGYTTFHNPRRRNLSTTYRSSGGIVVLVRDRLAKFVQPITPHIDDSLWLKAHGHALGLDHDIAIGFIYIQPNAPKERDPFSPLRTGLERVSEDMPCYIFGDLNARTGDCCPPMELAPFRYVDCIMQEEMEIEHAPRQVLQDKGVNPYGRELTRLMAVSHMVILNGTALDVTKGAYTCYTQPTNPSTVDLFLSSASLHQMVQELKMLSYLPDITDHCALSITTPLTIEAPRPRALTRVRSSELYSTDLAGMTTTSGE